MGNRGEGVIRRMQLDGGGGGAVFLVICIVGECTMNAFDGYTCLCLLSLILFSALCVFEYSVMRCFCVTSALGKAE